MLPISGKMARLYDECVVARQILYKVEAALNEVNDDSNLTAKIGCFLTSQDPNIKFAILRDDSHEIANLLRKVCTGEVSAKDAHQKVASAIDEICIICRGLHHMKEAKETQNK